MNKKFLALFLVIVSLFLFCSCSDDEKTSSGNAPVSDSKTESEQESATAFTVSFDSKGGSKVGSLTVKKGDALGELPTPKREGYKFVAWTDSNGTPFHSDTKVNENLNLFATWESMEEEKEKALTVLNQPKDAEIEVGDNVTFTVEIDGGSKPYEFVWYYQNELENVHGQVPDEPYVKGRSTDVLTIENVPTWLGETYFYCVVTDKSGNELTSEKALLTVNFS